MQQKTKISLTAILILVSVGLWINCSRPNQDKPVNIKPGLHQKQSSPPLLAALPAPQNYQLKQSLGFQTGALFQSFEPIQADFKPAQTIRVVQVHVQQWKNLKVLLAQPQSSRLVDHYLSFAKLASDSPYGLIVNWAFFGLVPAGDIQGWHCPQSDGNCQRKSYTKSQHHSGQATDKRYCLALSPYQNQMVIFRGGLAHVPIDSDAQVMCGGILLFDQKTNPEAYQSIGKEQYLQHYLRQNEARITQATQGGDPHRRSPRTALGRLANGNLVIAQISEGLYQRQGGSTPLEWAQQLKAMNWQAALLFDGSGATVMQIKNTQGKRIEQTQPYQREPQNFDQNVSFLVLPQSKE